MDYKFEMNGEEVVVTYCEFLYQYFSEETRI